MKSKLLFIGGIFCCLFYVSVFHMTTFAHPNILDVTYDMCQPAQNQEGEGELWYLLYRPLLECKEYFHLGEDMPVIRYYVLDHAKDNLDYTWTTDVSKEIADEIQDAFIKSLCKWNDVFFYTYDQEGHRTKRPLITIEEGTKENYNLLICPIDATAPYVASTAPLGEGIKIDTPTPYLRHIHYEQWYMNVNLHYFYHNQDVTDQDAFIHKERTGMHELGHVLGLRDMDAYCASYQHHEELLMGYGNGANCQLGATYQDIAGIAITRGLHTDEDHIWMKRVNRDHTIDLICTICNGIMKNVKTAENSIIDYQSCNHYGGDTSHMLLVASFGHLDYFKCQRCRHIDTIEWIETDEIHQNNSRIKDVSIINALSKMYYKLNIETFQFYQMVASSYEPLQITLYNENLERIEPQIKKDNNKIKDREYALSKGIYYLEIENNKSNKDVFSLDIGIQHPIQFVLDYSIQILFNIYDSKYPNDARLNQCNLNEVQQEERQDAINTIYLDDYHEKVMCKYQYEENINTVFAYLTIFNETPKSVKIVNKEFFFTFYETIWIILEDRKIYLLY